jgi:predicted DNA-binding protein
MRPAPLESRDFSAKHWSIPPGFLRPFAAKSGRSMHEGIAFGVLAYYYPRMAVLTCKLPLALEGRLAALARRRGVSKSVLVREAIEAKIANEAATPAAPANLIEALGESVGSIRSGKRDLARNKKHLQGYGR